MNDASKVVQLLDEIHHEMYHRKYKDVVTDFNMSKEQIWILWKLRRAKKHKSKEYSVGNLAKKFNVAHNTMSERISRLEEKGLINRVQSANDRRKYFIELSIEGKNLINRIDEEHKKLFALSVKEGLNAEKTETLAKLLNELVCSIREE
jgi:MarR family transcriptional regulator, organic hydroperoxide resistance regulator